MHKDFEERIGLGSGDLDLLENLQQQSLKEIIKQRQHERIEVRVRVGLRPGNASDADRGEIVGTSRDISKGGCAVVFEVPPCVGDVYRMTFSHKDIELPMLFARCLRCVMVREDTFEAGFRFFSPLEISGEISAKLGNLLG